jgi:hypothetical protein
VFKGKLTVQFQVFAEALDDLKIDIVDGRAARDKVFGPSDSLLQPAPTHCR